MSHRVCITQQGQRLDIFKIRLYQLVLEMTDARNPNHVFYAGHCKSLTDLIQITGLTLGSCRNSLTVLSNLLLFHPAEAISSSHVGLRSHIYN